jgi:hypothetical protein
MSEQDYAEIGRFIARVTKVITADSKGARPVVLLHFRRGATPIVEGILHAREKIEGKTRRRFSVAAVPVSRENYEGEREPDQAIREHLKAIPDGSIVYYVDEVVTGNNGYNNIRLLEKEAKRHRWNVHAHFLVSDGGRNMSNQMWGKMRRLSRAGAHTVSHPMDGPDRAPGLRVGNPAFLSREQDYCGN